MGSTPVELKRGYDTREDDNILNGPDSHYAGPTMEFCRFIILEGCNSCDSGFKLILALGPTLLNPQPLPNPLCIHELTLFKI